MSKIRFNTCYTMNELLKRKPQVNENPSDQKKMCKENCPHALKCYRRNPHHFMEYEHPHLNDMLNQTELFLPNDFPQDKDVIVAQLEILRGLRNKKPTNIITHVPKVVTSASSSNLNNENSARGVKNKKLSKTTSFVPNSKNNSTASKTNSGTMAEKHKLSEPYNLFFTKLPDAALTHSQRNSITFPDLICPSLGDLKCSLQINFMIDVMWLMEQYEEKALAKKPLTILYGYEFPNMKEYMNKMLPNVTHHYINMKDPFGTHHSKVGIYSYTDGSIRIVVSTANLYYEDWNHYNQGLWISPSCPPLAEDSAASDGIGPTSFKTTLIKYLKHYNVPCLKQWIDCVSKADFSRVKVFLVTSVPGKHYPADTESHLQTVGELLSRHCELPAKTTPESEGALSWGIIAQASSIGSLGKTPAEWLRRFLLRSLASHKQGPLPSNSQATISVVFPSKDNVLNSYYGPDGGGCLPYSKEVNEKQKWLKDYLHQWKADHTHRSRAMPHIKTYCRVSPCTTKLAWFLITSSNISKSAWGGNVQKDSGVYVRSYEMGVLFLPKFFEQDYFKIKSNDGEDKVFPFIFDIPLTAYKNSDFPWCN